MKAIARFVFYPWIRLKNKIDGFTAEKGAAIDAEFDKSVKANREIIRQTQAAEQRMDVAGAKFVEFLADQTNQYSKIFKDKRAEVNDVSGMFQKVREGNATPEELFQAMIKAKMVDPSGQGPESLIAGARKAFVEPVSVHLDPIKQGLVDAKKELQKLEEKITEDNIRHMRMKANQPKQK